MCWAADSGEIWEGRKPKRRRVFQSTSGRRGLEMELCLVERAMISARLAKVERETTVWKVSGCWAASWRAMAPP